LQLSICGLVFKVERIRLVTPRAQAVAVYRAKAVPFVERNRLNQLRGRLQLDASKAEPAGVSQRAIHELLSDAPAAGFAQQVHLAKLAHAVSFRVQSEGSDDPSVLSLDNLEDTSSLDVARLDIIEVGVYAARIFGEAVLDKDRRDDLPNPLGVGIGSSANPHTRDSNLMRDSCHLHKAAAATVDPQSAHAGMGAPATPSFRHDCPKRYPLHRGFVAAWQPDSNIGRVECTIGCPLHGARCVDNAGMAFEWKTMTTILGIETSCDETSAAVVVDGCRVLSNIVASQVDLHRKYGGVVPEIASRAHIERLDAVILEAMEVAGSSRDDIDAIAVTNRPGLVGALIIGVTAAKTLSWAWQKPLVSVNHIEAHACSPAIELDQPPWPAVGLIVSGGHTTLYRIESPTLIERLGATTDDAAGEAFDKVATILGLDYPGGPEIERISRDGNPRAVNFPRTMLGPESLDFSFSGIKTAVLYHVHGHGRTTGGLEKLSAGQIADIAASFQQAIVDVLVRKTMLAVKQTGVRTVVLGGGVAANSALRSSLAEECRKRSLTFHAAKTIYCTDNAAMIAARGYHLFASGETATLDLDAYASG